MRIKPIDWARQYAATMDDATSLRHMRRFALFSLEENARLRATVVAAGGEELARKEWDPGTEPENEESREAVRLIEARLAELGLEP